MEKRGQYFTIDAFIALLVIATSVFLLLGLYVGSPSPDQPRILSQEFVSTLERTKIKEINDPWLKSQIRDGNITNTDNTLLQQAFIFDKKDADVFNNANLDAYLLGNVTNKVIPPQFDYAIFIDGKYLYGRGTSGETAEVVASGEETAEILISNKRLVFAYVDQTEELIGPVLAEVRVWQ